jgi:pimeloyl-ACP methyl ester carboxylesterase
MGRKLFLLCGVLTALLYVAMNAFVPLLWPGFSSFSQTISELSAIDAPTRTLWIVLGTVYAVLLMAFGYGVWLCGLRSRPLRIAGGLIIADGVFCLFWPPMHQRAVLAAGGATLTDTLHIAWTMVSGVLLMLSIGLSAAVFGGRFRAFASATIMLLVAFGAVTGTYTASVQANLPTPWLGVWERVDAGLLMLWLIVLAVALLRRGDMTAAGIAEEGCRRLGGVDQWVMIRGEDVTNPPLICLHGGPGFSETWLLRYFNAVLEKSFTVVHWDQRGAGKSFHRNIAKSSMTVEQFIADLDQLVDIVRARLGQNKVVIFGHSWGSALGVLYAARFPEKVSVYVGGAQIGDCAASESASYTFTVAEAQRLDNHKALKALAAIGRPPYPSASSVFTERTWSQRLDGQLRPSALWNMARIALGGPESVLLNLVRTIRGFRFTMNAMWPDVSTLNLPKLVPTLRMPVFFFLGRRDHWVPPETSVAYFDALTAPLKTLVWFERSGHEMFADEPDKFNRTMVELVLPAAREPVRAAA